MRRIEPKDGKGSGSRGAMDHGSTAKARGLAAISAVKGMSKGGNFGSRPSDGQHRDGAHGAGSSSASGQDGAPMVEFQIDQLAEDVELRLHLRAPRLHEDGQGGYHSEAAGGQDRHQQGSAADITRYGPGIVGDSISRRGDPPGRADDEPWKLEWYSHPPYSKSDRWDDSLWSQHGWMVRCHGKERQQPFHPIHRSTPFPVESLHEERVTVVFTPEGKEVMLDHRQQAKSFPVKRLKVEGLYTFFKKKEVGSAMEISERQFRNVGSTSESAAVQRGDARTTFAAGNAWGAVAASTACEVAAAESDGSYECVDS